MTKARTTGIFLYRWRVLLAGPAQRWNLGVEPEVASSTPGEGAIATLL